MLWNGILPLVGTRDIGLELGAARGSETSLPIPCKNLSLPSRVLLEFLFGIIWGVFSVSCRDSCCKELLLDLLGAAHYNLSLAE